MIHNGGLSFDPKKPFETLVILHRVAATCFGSVIVYLNRKCLSDLRTGERGERRDTQRAGIPLERRRRLDREGYSRGNYRNFFHYDFG
jgi:hypothetical protein